MDIAAATYEESKGLSRVTINSYWMHGMNTIVENGKGMFDAYVPRSAVALAVSFDDAMMHVSLADGRMISVPLTWFQSLRNATQAELENYEISPAGIGIHWPDLDEDLSVAGLMAGVDWSAA